jgi:hypothetical protein
MLSLSPNTKIVPHKFDMLTFYKQFNQINELSNELKACMHYEQQLSINAIAGDSKSKLINTSMSRYGMYCAPEFEQLSYVKSIIKDDAVVADNVIVPALYKVPMYNLTSYKYDLSQYIELPITVTHQQKIFVNANNEYVASDAFIPFRFAAELTKFATLSTQFVIQDISRPYTINIEGIYSSMLQQQSANKMIGHITKNIINYQLSFVDSDGVSIQPISTIKNADYSVTVQFDPAGTKAVICTLQL